MKRQTDSASAADTSKKPRVEAPGFSSSTIPSSTIGSASQYPCFYQDPHSYSYPFDVHQYPHLFTGNTIYPSLSSWLQPQNPQHQTATTTVIRLSKLPQPPSKKQTPQKGSSKVSAAGLKKNINTGQRVAAYTPIPTSSPTPTPGTVIATAISTSTPQPESQELRTVFVGKIPEAASMKEILDLVTTGNVEEVRQVRKKQKNCEKVCAFITFVDSDAAAQFLAQGRKEKWRIRKQVLELNWGALTPVVPKIAEAVKCGASRCVCVGRLDRTVSKEMLETDFSRFGQVESLKLLVDKKVAYVYFTSVESAMKAKAALSIEHQYLHRRLSFGMDRCAQLALSRIFLHRDDKHRGTEALTRVLTAEGKRNVFLGNLHEDTTIEEICDVVKGGLLSFIKRRPKRKSAFVCFVDPRAAAEFVDYATMRAIKIKERKLKVGWGEDTAHRLPEDVINAFRMGATRTVYIANIKGLVRSQLKTDFAAFGEVEKVSIFQGRDCAFINFSNVMSAVEAIQGIKESKPDYASRQIGYGRDRCARPLDVTYSNVLAEDTLSMDPLTKEIGVGDTPSSPGQSSQCAGSRDIRDPSQEDSLAKEALQESDDGAGTNDSYETAGPEESDDDMDMSD
ncbi:hypothetical protein BGW39_004420 [Mortierella sp. 14UC]|nr:hypothetical protein BGW39_004420 [Mortierella sp. 14UC]